MAVTSVPIQEFGRRGAIASGAITSVGLSTLFGLVAGCGEAGPLPGGLLGEDAPLGQNASTRADCAALFAPTVERPVDIVSWWETDAPCVGDRGESCAARVLEAGCFGEPHGVTFVSKDRSKLLNELAGANTADGAIVNMGADIANLSACSKAGVRASIGDLGTVDAPIARFLTERTPQELLPYVTCGGHLFGVVLGLHRLNQLYFNQEILARPEVSQQLDAKGIDPAHLELDQFVEVLRVVSEVTKIAKPLVIESDTGSRSQFVFENLMVAVAQQHSTDGTPQAYLNFWRKLRQVDDSPEGVIDMRGFDETLDQLAELERYISYENRALTLVEEGKAVFTVSGDWMTPEASVGTSPFPGTHTLYVYTADVAVAVRHGESIGPSAQDPIVGFFKEITSAQVQKRYSSTKGSLPTVRDDNGVSRALTSDELFNDQVGVPGLPAFVPYDTFNRLEAFWEDVADSGVAGARDKFRQYVLDEYCRVAFGKADCDEMPDREPG